MKIQSNPYNYRLGMTDRMISERNTASSGGVVTNYATRIPQRLS